MTLCYDLGDCCPTGSVPCSHERLIARSNGTSMISLVIPPKDQVARVNKMLGTIQIFLRNDPD
jgi:hypothetical protein